jgi:hypothetical protein
MFWNERGVTDWAIVIEREVDKHEA